MKKEFSYSHILFVLSLAAVAFIQFTSFCPNEIRLLSLLGVCLLCILDRKTVPISKQVGLMLVFFAITFLYVYFLGRGHFFELRNIALPYTMMLTCMFIAPSILRFDYKDINIVYYIFSFGLIVTLVATAIIVQFDPNAVRTLGFGNAEGESENALADMYSRMGMISYMMGHILPVIVCMLTVKAIEHHKKIIKIFLWVILVFAMYVMYSATITTALLCSVLFIFLIIIYYIAKGNFSIFILMSFIIGVVLLLSGGMIGLLTEALQGSNNAINEKIQDIILSIQEGGASGQLEGRNDHWKITFDVIMKNPFFGGASGPNDTGLHVLFLDYWAWYGLFSLIMFVAWWSELKKMKKILGKKMWGSYLLCLSPVLIMALTKGPHFLPAYFFATLLILRVGFMNIVLSKKD